MARAATYTNQDGLIIGFGTHSIDDNIPAVTSAANGVKTMQVVIDALKMPTFADAWADGDRAPQSAIIKRGSRITNASLTVLVAFAGAGTLNIGTWGIPTKEYPITAAVDDADGIDAAIATTALDAVGASVACDGALVNGVRSCGSVSQSDVVISWANADDDTNYTAGRALLTIQYIEPTGFTQTKATTSTPAYGPDFDE